MSADERKWSNVGSKYHTRVHFYSLAVPFVVFVATWYLFLRNLFFRLHLGRQRLWI